MDEPPIDTRTAEERAESYRYWAKQSDAAKWNETVRLSIEHYGMPIGDLRDGPFRKYRINPDGTRTLISETFGPIRYVLLKGTASPCRRWTKMRVALAWGTANGKIISRVGFE